MFWKKEPPKQEPIPVIRGYVDTVSQATDAIDWLEYTPSSEILQDIAEVHARADKIAADGTFESQQTADFMRSWIDSISGIFLEKARRVESAA